MSVYVYLSIYPIYLYIPTYLSMYAMLSTYLCLSYLCPYTMLSTARVEELEKAVVEAQRLGKETKAPLREEMDSRLRMVGR